MKAIQAPNFSHLLHGQTDLISVSEGISPVRLRAADQPWIFPMLWEKARQPAGVRIALRTNAQNIGVRFTTPILNSNHATQFDLLIDGNLYASDHTKASTDPQELVWENLPKGDKQLEIYLPQSAVVVLHSLLIPAEATLAPIEDRRPRWLTYGSSITQCGAAHSPSRTWPVTAARLLNWNLTCMGFGGQCHFDQIVARTIANGSWDYISLCLGINTSSGTFSTRTWQAAVEGFIFTLRDAHPTTPLLILSPIASPERETIESDHTRMGLEYMRDRLTESVHKFREAGDQHIHYLSGLELLSVEEAPTLLLPDGVHPNGDGYESMGRNFAAKGAPLLQSGTSG